MHDFIRTHLGISCIVLGLVLTALAALLSPGGDIAGAFVWQVSALVLTVAFYLFLRRRRPPGDIPNAERLASRYAGFMAWSDDDKVMADLRNWLGEQGFVVFSDDYDPDHFGNQVVKMARPVGIRLVRDRGQWWIDLLGPDGTWSPLAGWLNPSADSRREALSAADQSRLLRESLQDIERRAIGEGQASVRVTFANT